MKLETLKNALEHLIEERKIIQHDAYSIHEHDELKNIIAEILDTTYQEIGMQELEIKFNHAMKLDINTLEKGVNIIRDANPQNISVREEDPLVIDATAALQDLDKFISHYKSNNVDKVTTAFNIELFCESRFDNLLATFDINNPVFDELQNLVSLKLKNLNNDDLLLLWAKIKSCFNNNEKNSAYRVYDEIIPPDFFTSANITSIRDKCAAVLVKYKPLTIKKMYEDGVSRFPVILPGVPKILSLTNTSDLSPITSIESLLVRSISQIIAAYESVSNELGLSSREKRSELASMLGANPSGFIFDGDFYSEYTRSIKSKDKCSRQDKDQLVLLNVKRLVEYSKTHAKQHMRAEDALKHYKIGQEVIHPARAIEFKKSGKKLELYLQKDMCKFLLERNILAYGVTLGRNQIDLYHKEITGEDFVIEAKVYKTSTRISIGTIKKNIVQLQSYMDAHDQPRGVLAIYNFTDTLLVAPRKWLGGRIRIICINLCSASPSQRKSSVEIIESSSSVIEMIRVNNDT